MKITAKRNFCLKGAHIQAGETVETDYRTARDLINMGRAAEAAEAPQKTAEKTGTAPKKPLRKKKTKPEPPAEDNTEEAAAAE